MIIKGTIEEISGGSSTDHYTVREYIIIDGITYKKVELSNYMDERISVGDNVEFTVKKLVKTVAGSHLDIRCTQ